MMTGPSAPLDSYGWASADDPTARLVFWVCVSVLVFFSAAALVLLSGVDAPYGRYNNKEDIAKKPWLIRMMSGLDLNPTFAWILQESPTLAFTAWGWWTGANECKASVGNVVVLALFVIHYVNRTFIFPFRQVGSKPIPFTVCMSAFTFCCCNGFVQAMGLTRLLLISATEWTTVLGAALWAFGLYINIDADHRLRSLRKPGETGYKVPYGGAFEYVSGANFFGETVEWCGYAIAMGGALPGVMFAICTICNVGPRACGHHRWYHEKFRDQYPKDRKAYVPFLL